MKKRVKQMEIIDKYLLSNGDQLVFQYYIVPEGIEYEVVHNDKDGKWLTSCKNFNNKIDMQKFYDVKIKEIIAIEKTIPVCSNCNVKFLGANYGDEKPMCEPCAYKEYLKGE